MKKIEINERKIIFGEIKEIVICENVVSEYGVASRVLSKIVLDYDNNEIAFFDDKEYKFYVKIDNFNYDSNLMQTQSKILNSMAEFIFEENKEFAVKLDSKEYIAKRKEFNFNLI
jgi:hypothetical protein